MAITVRIIGGLGNQMFQYALGRTLSHLHNTELLLDTTGFEKYKLHKYGLDKFNLNNNVNITEGIPPKKQYLPRLFKHYYNRKHIKEKNYNFDPNILKVENGYLDGYWQSDKYFNRNIIKNDFGFKIEQNDTNKLISDNIKNCNSVSVHIRRGDYVYNKLTNKVHGTCNQDYYNDAISLILDKVREPSFFIFSDDIQWVKNNLQLPHSSIFIDNNTVDTNYEDMRLMSHCKHNIIANSSFSWWGAWLNNKYNKIVITPKKWFNDKSLGIKDRIPEGWIKI